MEEATEDKKPLTVEQLEAKRLFDDLKVALNDLSHYGSPPHIIQSVAIVHDNLVREYNETYFPKGPEGTAAEAVIPPGSGTPGEDETKSPGDPQPPPAGTRERKPRHQ